MLLAVLCGLLATACGSGQTGPGPLPSASPALPAAWGAVHVQRSVGLVDSYVISPDDGRLALVGTVPAVPGERRDRLRLASDPGGRFVFAASDSRIQTHAVGRDGRLTPGADLQFTSAVALPGCNVRAESLSANRQFVYLVTSCWASASGDFALDRFSFSSDGKLVALGSTALGEDYFTSGSFLAADPGGQAVYRQRGVKGLLAQEVQADGTLSEPPAALSLANEWYGFEAVGFARGFLIVRQDAGFLLASLAFHAPSNRLELRTQLRVLRPTYLAATAFGPSGVVVSRYLWDIPQPPVYEDTATLYEVGESGRLTPGAIIPDPNHHYAETRSMAFHASGRLAYGLRGREVPYTLRALAAGPAGELSLIQEIPGAQGEFVLTPPPP